MGIALELCILFVIQTLAHGFFAGFEGETSAIKKIMKWLILAAVTLGLYYWVGHYALLFPCGILLVGMVFHVRWCKKHGIDPIKATPRKKYYQLRGWKREE